MTLTILDIRQTDTTANTLNWRISGIAVVSVLWIFSEIQVGCPEDSMYMLIVCFFAEGLKANPAKSHFGKLASFSKCCLYRTHVN